MSLAKFRQVFNSPSLGSIIFDGILCKITEIALEDQIIYFRARSVDILTCTVDTYGEAVVFDNEGNLVFRVPSVSKGDSPCHTKDGYLYVNLPLKVSTPTSRTNSSGIEVKLEPQ